MSAVATPTGLPRRPRFPHLLPNTPRTHPTPLPRQGNEYGHLNEVRDLQREMDDLSDEESELEDINMAIHNRGFNFLIPIGRTLTQQEEKNDADEDSQEEGSEEDGSARAPSGLDEDVDPSEEGDLDASMEDMDQDEEEEEEEEEEDLEASSDT